MGVFRVVHDSRPDPSFDLLRWDRVQVFRDDRRLLDVTSDELGPNVSVREAIGTAAFIGFPIALAGSLGYTRLAAACRILEAAVTGGSDEADALGHVRGAIRDVLAERPAA